MIMRFVILALLLTQGPTRPEGVGTVTGRILDQKGSPARSVRVAAIAVPDASRPNGAMLGIAETDADGRYRLRDVPAGRYHIAAGPLDSLTYFPGVVVSDKATVVTVAPNAELTGIDFSLVTPPLVRVSGIIVNENNNAVTPSGMFGVAPRGGRGIASATTNNNPTQVRLMGPAEYSTSVKPDGTFELLNVRSGTYQAVVTPASRMAPTTVTVGDTDLTDVRLLIPRMVNIMGVVNVEGGGPRPGFFLLIAPVGATQKASVSARGDILPNNGTNVNTAMGPFNLSVLVGEYQVSLSNLQPLSGFTIKSMTAGATNLLTDNLKVTAEGAPVIRVLLSPPPGASTKLTGRFVGRGIPDATPNIVLTATDAAPNPSPPAAVYLDGSFEFPKVLPGNYVIRASTPINTDRGPGNPSQLLATVTVGAAGVTGLLVDTALLAPISTTNTAGTVPAGARVRGRIVGAARRSGPVTVTLTAGAPATPLAAPIFWDGTFEFPAVPNGTYAASVQPSIPGAKPTTVTVANSRPVADLEIRVPASREVSGIVTINGPGTLPAKAGFLLAAADGSSTNRVSAPIQPDGTFTLTIPEGVTVRYATDLLPSGYSVDSITFAGRDTENQPITLTATNSAELSVRLNAARATTVRVNGRVIGAPLVEGRIWLTSAARSIASIETAVQTGGAFSFANVLPGDYILRIVAAGIPASLPAGTIRVADKNIDGLELAGPLFVTGRVVVAGGGNASRFSLPLQSAAGEATITIDPQQDGSFRVALPAGAWQTGAPVGLPTGMKISSMTYGAIDISQAPLRVTATDTAVLTISLSR